MSRKNGVSDGKRRQLEGSRRGSAIVREHFNSTITRRVYCELVGIHATTLSKWEKKGIVEPQIELILNSPTRVFTEDDVELGKEIIRLLRSNPGLYSVSQAAEVVRGRQP